VPLKDLRSFLTVLEAAGELVRVGREVDPRFEIAAVLHRIQREHNRAVLFERVAGSEVPVVGNVFGSFERIARLLEVPRSELAATWSRSEDVVASWPDGGGAVADLPYAEVPLADLPFLTHCEKDGGPYITAGIALARDPLTGICNYSYHRMQVANPPDLGFRITPGNHLGVYHAAAEARGEALPVAVLIGAPPIVMLAAASRLPLRVDELRLAAVLNGERLPVQKCRTLDLHFPAGTEIVLEGELLSGVRAPEGPFGDFMDFYLPVGLNPVFRVHHAFMRPGGVYYGLYAGSVEQLLIMGVPTAANILRALQRIAPAVSDVAIWPYAYQCVIRMREEFDEQAKQVLLAAFAAEPSYLKMATVVDEDVDIYDPADVAWAVACRSRPDRDVMVIPNVPSFRVDPDALHRGRVGIDATVPFGAWEEHQRRRIPGEDQIRLADYI
jgi:UbiD family decarboxylase